MEIRALVVDDSGIMRKMVMRSLKESELAQFIFIEACDGVDALEKFKGDSIDMIFVDWNMPNMNGIDFVKEVRSIEKHHIPVVMITGEDTMGKMDEATAAVSVDKYIAKPFTPDGLKKRIEPLFEEMASSQKSSKGFFAKLVD